MKNCQNFYNCESFSLSSQQRLDVWIKSLSMKNHELQFINTDHLNDQIKKKKTFKNRFKLLSF